MLLMCTLGDDLEEGELEDETGQAAQPTATESLPPSTAIPTLTSSTATTQPQQSQSVGLKKEEEKSQLQHQQLASTSGVGGAEPGPSGSSGSGGGGGGEESEATTTKRVRQPIVWGSGDAKPPLRKIIRRIGQGQTGGTGKRRLKPPRK